MDTAPIRVEGDGSLGYRIGAWFLAPLVPGLALYELLGPRSLIGVLGGGLGVTLALLAPAAFFAGWRLARQTLVLEGGRLKVASHLQAIDVGVEEVEAVELYEASGGFLMVAVRARGQWIAVDPRGFAREPLLKLVEALRAARPGLEFVHRTGQLPQDLPARG